MFTYLKSLSSVPVTISNKSVFICNRFYTIRVNNCKITFLGEYSSLTPSFVENLLTQGHKILSRKNRVLEAAQGKDFVIIACTVLIQITSVTDDRRTDKRTDA